MTFSEFKHNKRVKEFLSKKIFQKLTVDIDKNYKFYLMTIKFEKMPSHFREEVAKQTISNIYGPIARYWNRYFYKKPKEYWPKLICCPDFPIYKREKKSSISDYLVNDGFHYHGILALPYSSNETDFVEYYTRKTIRMKRYNRYLNHIDIRKIDENLEYTIDYCIKHQKNSNDYILLEFPVSKNDMKDYSIMSFDEKFCEKRYHYP